MLDILLDAGVQVELDDASSEIVKRRKDAYDQMQESRVQGRAVKAGELDQLKTSEFVHFLGNRLKDGCCHIK